MNLFASFLGYPIRTQTEQLAQFATLLNFPLDEIYVVSFTTGGFFNNQYVKSREKFLELANPN